MKNRKRFFALALSLILVLSVIPFTAFAADEVPYLDENGEIQTISDYTEINPEMTELSDGWYVLTDDVTISSTLVITGDVYIILTDIHTLTCSDGIKVSEDNSLTVFAQTEDEDTMGAIEATAGTSSQAGIGGGQHEANGEITINGGYIMASGTGSALSVGAAGIGTGAGNLTNVETSQAITINGGIVEATGGYHGAGIGGGNYSTGSGITINGGTVIAEGGNSGAGIGGGSNEPGTEIVINGGTVTAEGGSGGAGIGGGSSGAGNYITINGGTVTAEGSSGAGIGGGSNGRGTYITINGGTVNATGGTSSAGIGGGSSATGNNITITGGTVTAVGYSGSLTSASASAVGAGYGLLVTDASDIYVAPEDVGCSIAVFIGSSDADSELADGAPFANGTTSDDLADEISGQVYFYSYEVNEHLYMYLGEDNVMTAVCQYCGESHTAVISAENAVYNGSAQETANVEYSEDWPGGDFTVHYTDNVNAGTAGAYIQIDDAVASAEFTISPKSIFDDTVYIDSIAVQCYTGNEITPDFEIHDYETGNVLVEDTDYSVSYSNNVDLGDATIAITGQGNYNGTTVAGFTISEHDYEYTADGNTIYETCTRCGLSSTATIYAEDTKADGSAKETAYVEYSENWAAGELTITYENNIGVGTATAYITIGDATASVDFTIEVDGVYYLDENGTQQVCSEYTVITSSSTSLSTGWYAVTEDTTVSSLITVSGEVHLILCDNCTLTSSGINVSTGNSICIYAQTFDENTAGVLNSSGGSQQAGIGSGNHTNCGSITINGGVITASGGGSNYNGAAGIGTGAGGTSSSNHLSVESITINNGFITATGGSNYAAGIGGGYEGDGTNITINGGTVTATGGERSAGIGGGAQGTASNIIITGGTVTATGGKITLGSDHPGIGRGNGGDSASDIYIYPQNECSIFVLVGSSSASDSLEGSPFAHNVKSDDLAGTLDDYRYFYSYEVNEHQYDYTADGNVITGECDFCGNIETAEITAEDAVYNSLEHETATVAYSDNWTDGELEISYEDNIYPGTAKASITIGGVTAYTNFTITALGIEDGHINYLDENGDTQICTDFTLIDQHSDLSSGWYAVSGDETLAERISISGDVYLIIADNSSLTAEQGIDVPDGSSLTIYAQSVDKDTMGGLNAYGVSYAAGIGGGDSEVNGTITIVGGNITAVGGLGAAGIGGGYPKTGKDITILGGIVSAIGSTGGAGIGGGWFAPGVDIVISGGTVTAEAGFEASAVGGGGGASETSSTVYISPKNVECSITAYAGDSISEMEELADSSYANNTETNVTSEIYGLTYYSSYVNDEHHFVIEVAPGKNEGTIYYYCEYCNEILSMATVTAEDVTYDGSAHEHAAVEYYSWDFDDVVLSYENNIEEGVARVYATINDVLDTTLIITFNIGEADISEADISVKDDLIYTSDPLDIGLTVMEDEVRLTESEDYEITIEDAEGQTISEIINAGTYTVTITGTGSYGGSTTVTVNVGKADLTVAPYDMEIAYGSAVPDYTYFYSEFLGTDDETLLNGEPVLNCDYEQGSDAGEYEITIDSSSVTSDNYNILSSNGTLTVAAKSIASDTIDVYDIDNEHYTGSEITPHALIYDEDTGATLQEGTDYTLSYSDNVEVGTATITITGMGNYTDITYKTFVITQHTIQDAEISAAEDLVYTGSAQDLEIEVLEDGGELTEGVDYSIEITDENGNVVEEVINAGTYTVTITGTGSYGSSTTIEVTIAKADITVIADDFVISYGSPVPEYTYTYSGLLGDDDETSINGELVLTSDYEQGSDVGEYVISVDFSNASSNNYNITSSTVGSLIVVEKSIDADTIDVFDIEDELYTGEAIEPNVIVYDNEIEYILQNSTDYTLTYSDNVEAGTATVTITGMGNYTGTVEKTFIITQHGVLDAEISAAEDLVYTGSAQDLGIEVLEDDTELTEDVDYSIVITDENGNVVEEAVNAGTYTVTVIGQGNYSGSADIEVKIAKADITVTADDIGVTYGSSAPEYTYKYSEFLGDDDETSIEGELVLTSDYEQGSNAGTYEIAIDISSVSSNNYNILSVGGTLTVVSKSIDSNTIDVYDIDNEHYTGSEIAPHVLIYDNETGATLQEGTDYTLSYSDNVEVGTATITITGMGNYTDITYKTFVITQHTIQDAEISAAEDLVYTGSAQDLGIEVLEDGTELTEGVDYSIEITDENGNVVEEVINAGTYTVTITGTGSYGSSTTIEVTIAKADITVTAEDMTITYGSAVPEYTYTYSGFIGDDDETSIDGELILTSDYSQGSDVGEYVISVDFSNATSVNYNITSPVNGNLTVVEKSISSDTIDVYDIDNEHYTGEEIEPNVLVYDNEMGMTLQYGVDYVVSYSDNIEVGTATITVTGIGNYAGIVEKEFNITQHTIQDAEISAAEDLVYTGSTQDLGIEVLEDGGELTEGVDYSIVVTDENGNVVVNVVNAGTYYVRIIGKGHYGSSTTIEVTIAKADITVAADDMEITFGSSVPEYTYTYSGFLGDDDESSVDGELQLTSDYEQGSAVGTYEISVDISSATSVNYNITSSVNGTLTVTAKSLDSDTLDIYDLDDEHYTGAEITPSIEIYDNEINYMLQEGTDYTVSYENNIETGTAAVTIIGISNYTGTIEKTFNITTHNIDDSEISLNGDLVYTGSAQDLGVEILEDGRDLIEGTDYSIEIKDADGNVIDQIIDAGTYTITINGINNYYGEQSITFIVAKAELNIAADDISFSYGSAVPEYTYTYSGFLGDDDETSLEGQLLITSDYAMGSDIGEYEISVDISDLSSDNYNILSSDGTLSVTAKSIGSDTIDVFDIDDEHYDAEEIEPNVLIYDNETGNTLQKDVDFTLSYSNNINVGTATIIISGIGNYNGTAEKTFNIIQHSVVEAEITAVKNLVYNGSLQDIAMHVFEDGGELIEGVDYSIEITDEDGNIVNEIVNAGIYLVSIFGLGNYNEVQTISIVVERSNLDNAVIDLESSDISDILISVDGNNLIIDKDYIITVTDEDGNEVNDLETPGEYFITIEGIGNYTGKVEKEITIPENDLADADITLNDDLTYSGLPIDLGLQVSLDNNILIEGEDYTVNITDENGNSIPSVMEAGSYTMTIDGIGNYSGSQVISFEIGKLDIETLPITASIDDNYQIIIGYDNNLLIAGTDYSLVITDSDGNYIEGITSPGTYVLLIQGVGNYTGILELQLTIPEEATDLEPTTEDNTEEEPTTEVTEEEQNTEEVAEETTSEETEEIESTTSVAAEETTEEKASVKDETTAESSSAASVIQDTSSTSPNTGKTVAIGFATAIAVAGIVILKRKHSSEDEVSVK